MSLRQLALLGLLLFFGCSACSRDAPLVALEKAVTQLQENIEAKRSGAVLEQLHEQFIAEREYDRNWAKRTMALLFLRHTYVQVIALGKSSQIDPLHPAIGRTHARVALAGAEGLIPDSTRSYRVDLEWWLEDGEWRLARLDWE